METMADRLKHALEARRMKPADLIARKVLSKQTLYNILNGDTDPNKIWDTTIKGLCKALKVNRAWLMDGVGPMDAADAPKQSPGAAAGTNEITELRIAVSALASAMVSHRPAAALDAAAAIRKTAPIQFLAGGFLSGLIEALETAEVAKESRPQPRVEQ